MLSSRATNISSLLAAAMSVYVCLLVVDTQALAQKSSTIVAAQTQLRKSAANNTLSAPAATTQVERPLEKAADQSVKLSSQDEKAVAVAALPQETFCALLSKYLSLS